MDNNDILDFFAEAGKLKQVKRSGWWMVGAPREESVAEHSFRCAVIGYVLAKQEKVDPYKVLVMTLFNDIHEARINDQHKVAHKYLNVRVAEKKAFSDQIEKLDNSIKKEMSSFRNEYDNQNTPEGIVARDADILECLIQAKEYLDEGCLKAAKFFISAPDHLKSKSAKELWNSLDKWDSSEWWIKITKFER